METKRFPGRKNLGKSLNRTMQYGNYDLMEKTQYMEATGLNRTMQYGNV